MFRNILVAVDGSADAQQALAQAIDLARSENARVTLFSAVASPPSVAYVGASGDVTANLIREAEAEADAILRTAVERVPDDVSVTSVLSREPVRPALVSKIAAGEHDLVVMGSRGRGALRTEALRHGLSGFARAQPLSWFERRGARVVARKSACRRARDAHRRDLRQTQCSAGRIRNRR